MAERIVLEMTCKDDVRRVEQPNRSVEPGI
jgi:hypothetical protein